MGRVSRFKRIKPVLDVDKVFAGDGEHDDAPAAAAAATAAGVKSDDDFVVDFSREKNKLRAPRKPLVASAPRASVAAPRPLPSPGESLGAFNHRMDVETRLKLTAKAKSARAGQKRERKAALAHKKAAKREAELEERMDGARPRGAARALWDVADRPPELRGVQDRQRFGSLGGAQGIAGFASRVQGQYSKHKKQD